jgi:hypothetical protein
MRAKSSRRHGEAATPGCIIRGHARQAAQHVRPALRERTVVMTPSDTRARVDNIIFNETLRRFTPVTTQPGSLKVDLATVVDY